MDATYKIRSALRALLTLLCCTLVAACTSSEKPAAVDANKPGGQTDVGGEPEPAIIEAAWQAGPHADTFVLDATGENNTCANCHSPINWMPSMDELPESCLTCKFELEDPPPLVLEEDWLHIPCKTCHQVDKKGNVQPEVAWLEIAPIGEYAEVASSTELCRKCHRDSDLPGHVRVQLGGAHADYTCTGCHNPHDTRASCGDAGCHDDMLEPETTIAGHDEDHQLVLCGACHDGSGLKVGPEEEAGAWTTFGQDPEAGVDLPFTSHNIVLEVSCGRCHYSDNPWGLSGSVVQP